MEEFSDKLEIFKILKEIKKRENFNLALMSREERIYHISNQMEWVEDIVPRMVEYIEDEKDHDITQ